MAPSSRRKQITKPVPNDLDAAWVADSLADEVMRSAEDPPQACNPSPCKQSSGSSGSGAASAPSAAEPPAGAWDDVPGQRVPWLASNKGQGDDHASAGREAAPEKGLLRAGAEGPLPAGGVFCPYCVRRRPCAFHGLCLRSVRPEVGKECGAQLLSLLQAAPLDPPPSQQQEQRPAPISKPRDSVCTPSARQTLQLQELTLEKPPHLHQEHVFQRRQQREFTFQAQDLPSQPPPPPPETSQPPQVIFTPASQYQEDLALQRQRGSQLQHRGPPPGQQQQPQPPHQQCLGKPEIAFQQPVQRPAGFQQPVQHQDVPFPHAMQHQDFAMQQPMQQDVPHHQMQLQQPMPPHNFGMRQQQQDLTLQPVLHHPEHGLHQLQHQELHPGGHFMDSMGAAPPCLAAPHFSLDGRFADGFGHGSAAPQCMEAMAWTGTGPPGMYGQQGSPQLEQWQLGGGQIQAYSGGMQFCHANAWMGAQPIADCQTEALRPLRQQGSKVWADDSSTADSTQAHTESDASDYRDSVEGSRSSAAVASHNARLGLHMYGYS